MELELYADNAINIATSRHKQSWKKINRTK